MTNHNINVLKTFFDFYVITALDVFCGEKTLNHANKARRISEACVQVVDELYQMILQSLQYAVIREFRHLNDRAFSGRSPKQKKLSRAINLLFRVNKNGLFEEYEDVPEKYKYQIQFLEQSFRLPISWSFNEIAQAFEGVSWENKYGGKRWAKATKMLLELPKTHDEKVLWVDRVLDLYHNQGHLLNKSMVSILSKPKSIGIIPLKRKSALNFRKHAQTLSELSVFGSTKVRNLLIANKAKLPKQII
jgi:hypothetical protein